MQNEQYDPNAPGKLPGAGPGSGEQEESEWADIGRRIERQLRRDVARLVGAGEVDDWGSIKDALVRRAKGQAEALDSTEVGRRVQDISTQVEQQVRTGLAQASGAGPDADWASIGRTLRQRVENVLDPTSPPAPGDSGTGASVEDATIPAAPRTADRPPTPAPSGGEDTGLPTVTREVDEPPERPSTANGGQRM